MGTIPPMNLNQTEKSQLRRGKSPARTATPKDFERFLKDSGKTFVLKVTIHAAFLDAIFRDHSFAPRALRHQERRAACNNPAPAWHSRNPVK
jgi:hypothetical protein